MEILLVQYAIGDKILIFDKDSLIEFKNVLFKYPGNDRLVINNFDIKILGYEKLCIVGQNGSGKSTFINLLVRLYFPSDGEIIVNNININEYDYEKYQRLFAPVFQDFCAYNLFERKHNIA
jgi:ABC-type multidrug transport system fused ATPase/permease subunit